MQGVIESSTIAPPKRRGGGWRIAWTGAVLVHAIVLGVASLVVAGSSGQDRVARDDADDVVAVELRPAMPRSATRKLEPLPEPPPIDRAYRDVIVDADVFVRADSVDLEQLFAADDAHVQASAPSVAHADVDASHFARRMPGKSSGAGQTAAQGTQRPAGNGDGAGGATTAQSAVLVPPVVIANPQPVYPPQASRRHEEGQVLCRMHIRADGCVESVEVVRSSGSTHLDRAALDALASWRFQPATCDGQPIACVVEQTLTFELASASAR